MIKNIKGTKDLLPNTTYNLQDIENHLMRFFHIHGYGEIRTPIFETTELFIRSVGETTDIVNKEMYTWEDQNGQSLTLRPEMTASVVRAYIQKQLWKIEPISKFFYIGPLFRRERPQKGRLRQFHQFGIECIGDDSPDVDFEVIKIAWDILRNLNFNNVLLNVNSLGDSKDRFIYTEELKKYFSKYINDLPKVDKLRFERSPLRILDSKEDITIKISEEAPKTLDFISSESLGHHENLILNLEELRSHDKKFNYKINNRLVRGLDYYNKTVFEYTSDSLGPQGVLLGGGRYDPLIKILGGQDTPAVGFAMGIERVVNELKKNIDVEKNYVDAVIIVTDESLRIESVQIANNLRNSNIRTIIAPKKSIKAQMRFANNINSKSAVFIGKNELENQKLSVKLLQTKSEQFEIDIDDMNQLKKILNS